MSHPYGMNFDWTAGAVDRLRALFADGLSFSAIAAQLGEEYGRALTRNAALGKCHRLGLERGVSVGRRPVGSKRSQATRSTPFRAKAVAEVLAHKPAPAPAAEPVGAHRCGLLELRNSSCRWVVSAEGEAFLFCGEPEADFANGLAYCAHHQKRAHRRPGEQEAA